MVSDTFYLDQIQGSHNGNGRSPLITLISSPDSVGEKPGNTILYKKGIVVRGDFSFGFVFSTSPPIVGSYGKGNKPVFMKSINLDSTKYWIKENGNIWKCTKNLKETPCANIIYNNDEYCGAMRWKKDDLKKICALEISRKATEKGENRNPDVAYFVGSADDEYPFCSQEFDTLFMIDVIEHLVDIDQAILECNRILKENGNLIIITPEFNWLKKIIITSFFWESFFYQTNPHIRFFTKKSMDLIMEKHGFKRVYYQWGLSWFRIMPQNAYFVYEKIK